MWKKSGRKFPKQDVENYVENVENPWKQWKKRKGQTGRRKKKNMYRQKADNNSRKSKI